MSPYFLKIFVSSFIHSFIYSLNRSCMTIQYLIIKDEPPGSKYWGYRERDRIPELRKLMTQLWRPI